MPVAIGHQLRAARMAQGIAQVDLARRAGISASYLNLIEHDRRRIAGKLLRALADELGLDAGALQQGQASPLVLRLQSAAAPNVIEGAETLVARHPDWASLIAAQADRVDHLESRLAALSDRLTYDPHMEQALHDVISAVTSIRSTAAILTESEELDRDWQRRFHTNLHQDAVRLAERSAALMAGLEAPGLAALSPREEAERFLDEQGFGWPALESGATPQDIAAAAPDDAARALVLAWLSRAQTDCAMLPMAEFADLARKHDYAVLPLVLHFDAPADAILRRLTSLPEADGHPQFGFVIADGAGAMILRKPLNTITLPRGGGSCPLWPVFSAMAAPGQIVEAELSLPGGTELPLSAVAHAHLRRWPGMQAAPLMESMMLFRRASVGEGDPRLPVGPGCRVCPRSGCAARREPSVMAQVDQP